MNRNRDTCGADENDADEDDFDDPVALARNSLRGFRLYVQMEEARERVRRLTRNPESILNGDTPPPPPPYHLDELSVGGTLGTGQYCVVEEVTMMSRTRPKSSVDKVNETEESRDEDIVASSLSSVLGLPPPKPPENLWHWKRRKSLRVHSMESCVTAETETTDKDDDLVSWGSTKLSASQTSRSSSHSIPDEVTTIPISREEIPLSPLMSSPVKGTFRKRQQTYAMKRMLPDLLGLSSTHAMADLVREARFLSILSHPNVVGFCGTGGEAECHPTYFLLLERLVDTLDNRLCPEGLWVCQGREWDSKRKLSWKWWAGKTDGQSFLLEKLLIQRLSALLDIASALQYLHGNRILFRDLKAENVGFDLLGRAKVFDFGLVRELLPSDRVSHGSDTNEVDDVDDVFRATGVTGTLRYMAPEIIRCRPYGWKAESFAFGILLWEVATLQRYQIGNDPPNFAKLVVRKNKRPSPLPSLVSKGDGRPKTSTCLPVAVSGLLEQCLEADPAERPSMASIRDVLDTSLQAQNLMLAESQKEKKPTLSIQQHQELLAALCRTLGDE